MKNFMYSRGNLVWSDDEGNAVYEDGSFFCDTRPCRVCKIAVGSDEPDPCLGFLPGVEHACCGHGRVDEAYVLAGGIRYDSVLAWERATIGDTSDI